MTISLKSFRQLTNGFARNHHFNLGIIDWRDPSYDNPTIGKVVGALATPFVSMFCSGMTLPKKTISSESISIQYGIPGIKVAKRVEYTDWRITFYSDEASLLRFFFLRWMELINNTDDHSYALPGRYKSTLAYAALLSPQDIPCHVFTFKGLFPTEVSDLTLQQQDTNITTFDVTFTYDFFKINEPIGFGLALAHEIATDTFFGASSIGTNIGRSQKRELNLPFGMTIPLPF